MTDFLSDARNGYNEIAEFYAERVGGELQGKPFDKGMFAAFAELVSGGLVADIGCGPGQVTRYLNALGLNAFGIDLSPEMLAIARRENPQLRFDEGSMTALELEDDSLDGIVAKHSIIHVPPEHQPGVLAGFYRVLKPGGYVMLAFQVGDDTHMFTALPGKAEYLTFYRLRPERVEALLTDAGFQIQARMVRERDENEKTSQGYVIARRPPSV